MDLLKNIESILKDISLNTRADFVALYKNDEPIKVYSNLSNVVVELTGLLVRKTLLSSSDIIEEFNPEFLFAEGKNYGIFIYIIKDDVAIATIINEKPNFSLLKMVHEKNSKELIPYIADIEKLSEEIKVKKEKVVEEKSELKEEKVEDIAVKEVEETNELEELEKALSGDIDIKEEQDIIEEHKVEETVKEEVEVETPEEIPLEDILSGKEDEIEENIVDTAEEKIENIDELIKNIKQEFIKEIGPVGKIIFNKTLKSVGLEENPTMKKLKEFIDNLSKEISVEERRVKFIQDTKSIIGG